MATKTRSKPPKAPPAPEVPASVLPTPRPADAPPYIEGTLAPSDLRPSPTNPRRTFPEEGLRQLAASFAAHGVLQPLLVRPMGDAGRWTGKTWEGVEYFEVVAGERRLRAAALANLTGLPVVIRWLTDAEALEIQLVENDQREDVRPSEQAAAYARLVAAGRTVEQVVAATGKTASFVRSVLALAKLPAWALSAADAGTLPRRTAELVARVPGEESRKRAVYCVLTSATHPEFVPDNYEEDARRGGHEPLSYRDAKDLVSNHFTRQLKGCPFDRKSLDLVPAAGSCEACPKRAGNDPEAVAEGVRADVCLDPDCYAAKVAAYREREIAKAAAKGIEPADVEVPNLRRVPRGWCAVGSDLRLTEIDLAGVSAKHASKPLKELLAAPGCVSIPEFVAFGGDGKPVRLVKTTDAKKALVGIGVLKKPEPRKKEKPAPEKPNGKPEKKAGPSPMELENRTAVVLAERCRTMVLANDESLVELAKNGGPDTDAVYEALAMSARLIARDWLAYGSERRDAVVRFVPAAGTLNQDKDRAVDKAVGQMTPAEVVGLIFALSAQVAATDPSFGKDIVGEFIDYADTTLADCEEQARRELAPPEVKPADPEPAPAAETNGKPAAPKTDKPQPRQVKS